MKKSIKNLLLAGITMILFMTGCKKDYLQLDPPDVLTPTSVFSTTENAYAAINGIHRMMYRQWYGSQALGGHSGNMIYMEVLGDDYVMTANANGWFIGEYRWLNHRNDASTISRFSYGFYYTIIGNANVIIANIDNAVGPEGDKKAIKGQAYAYRAWAYFQMVQLFGERFEKGQANDGLGLSLVLESQTGALPRSSVNEVYTQINSDIDQAITLLN